jgi:hypothetical protein
MTDLQAMMDAFSDAGTRERSNYHLTYGDLIDALKAASAEAVFDGQVVGLGSYRGYYEDIALYTESRGVTASDTAEQFDGDFRKDYDEWRAAHDISFDSLPRTAHELAEALESLIGRYFTGYKGGEFEITRDKALWLASDYGDCSQMAVMAISKELALVTKEIQL